MLVPDAAATSMDFHDIILEDLVGTRITGPSSLFLAKLLPSGAVGPQLCSNICTNVRRTWSSYAVPVGDIMLASSAVGGLVLAHTVGYMLFLIWDYGSPLEMWSAVAVPSGVVHCVEGVCTGLSRSPAQHT